MGLGTEVVQDICMLAHWVEIFAMSGKCLSLMYLKVSVHVW